MVKGTAAGGGGRSMASNKQKVVNALTHLCLAGPHRSAELAAALGALRAAQGHNFLILLAAPETLSYRGLYTYEAHASAAHGAPSVRIHGVGPANLTPAILTASALEAGGGVAGSAAGGGGGAGVGSPPAPQHPTAPHSSSSSSSSSPALGGAAAAEALASSPYVVDACFKYATAGRCFAPISTRSVTLTTDAVTIRQRFVGKGAAASGAPVAGGSLPNPTWHLAPREEEE